MPVRLKAKESTQTASLRHQMVLGGSRRQSLRAWRCIAVVAIGVLLGLQVNYDNRALHVVGTGDDAIRGAYRVNLQSWAGVARKPTTGASTLADETTAAADPGPTTDSRYSICSQFDKTPSTAFTWREQHFRNSTLHASYFPDQIGSDSNFRAWVDQLYSYYTPERLRKATTSRPGIAAIRRIAQILSDYPTTGEPLEILVSGGSVTQGIDCTAVPQGIPHLSRRETYTCAWAARLQNIWNQVLFQGESRVRVTNMAAGGTSSDIANLALEYRLLPEDSSMPHIILLAHTVNDAFHKNDDNEVLFRHMQDIVQSAHKLRYCDADLPLVILLDDFYGGLGGVYKPVEQSSRVHAIAKWYQLMSISFGNVVGHELYSRNVEQDGQPDPLVGSKFGMHMGTGYHIGLAWTVMYSFLNEIVDACYQDPSSGIEASAHLEHWWPNTANTTEERAVLTLEQMETRGAPSKYIGYMKKETTEQSMLADWKARLGEKEVRCQSEDTKFFASPNNITSVCEYAWLSYRVTGIEWPRDLVRVLKPKLTHVDGWAAEGYPVRHPRTGWYAKKENAIFSLKITVSTLEVSALTVVVMQSYGPTFVGTNLSITVRIERGTEVESDTTTELQASFEVSGYHDIQTSVHVPFKFPMPGGAPAQVGDTIFFDASLTSGSNFNIYGLAFCKD